jgi:hypothetical protein
MTYVRTLPPYLGATRYAVDTEHTCHDRACNLGLVLDRLVELADGSYRLEGLRHDGTRIHVYAEASEVSK